MFIFHQTYTDKVTGLFLGNKNVECGIFVYSAKKSKCKSINAQVC